MGEGNEEILHEDEVIEVIDDEIVGRLGVEQAAIADFVAITGGESPTEAEFNAIGAKLNLVLARLRVANIIAP